ncbi:hypothetical protein llap_15478 [Limosa lapponica baueri]|uniref:Uncharacterized protein n=1 Tax=Limosa lapponica baueri TaxID=1758121 RepID=A0A2I0TK98_LIMLA|nr:hypothetical protein llap_15478 [Limosa lapponica baueri]
MALSIGLNGKTGSQPCHLVAVGLPKEPGLVAPSSGLRQGEYHLAEACGKAQQYSSIEQYIVTPQMLRSWEEQLNSMCPEEGEVPQDECVGKVQKQLTCKAGGFLAQILLSSPQLLMVRPVLEPNNHDDHADLRSPL